MTELCRLLVLELQARQGSEFCRKLSDTIQITISGDKAKCRCPEKLHALRFLAEGCSHQLAAHPEARFQQNPQLLIRLVQEQLESVEVLWEILLRDQPVVLAFMLERLVAWSAAALGRAAPLDSLLPQSLVETHLHPHQRFACALDETALDDDDLRTTCRAAILTVNEIVSSVLCKKKCRMEEYFKSEVLNTKLELQVQLLSRYIILFVLTSSDLRTHQNLTDTVAGLEEEKAQEWLLRRFNLQMGIRVDTNDFFTSGSVHRSLQLLAVFGTSKETATTSKREGQSTVGREPEIASRAVLHSVLTHLKDPLVMLHPHRAQAGWMLGSKQAGYDAGYVFEQRKLKFCAFPKITIKWWPKVQTHRLLKDALGRQVKHDCDFDVAYKEEQHLKMAITQSLQDSQDKRVTSSKGESEDAEATSSSKLAFLPRHSVPSEVAETAWSAPAAFGEVQCLLPDSLVLVEQFGTGQKDQYKLAHVPARQLQAGMLVRCIRHPRLDSTHADKVPRFSHTVVLSAEICPAWERDLVELTFELHASGGECDVATDVQRLVLTADHPVMTRPVVTQGRLGELGSVSPAAAEGEATEAALTQKMPLPWLSLPARELTSGHYSLVCFSAEEGASFHQLDVRKLIGCRRIDYPVTQVVRVRLAREQDAILVSAGHGQAFLGVHGSPVPRPLTKQLQRMGQNRSQDAWWQRGPLRRCVSDSYLFEGEAARTPGVGLPSKATEGRSDGIQRHAAEETEAMLRTVYAAGILPAGSSSSSSGSALLESSEPTASSSSARPTIVRLGGQVPLRKDIATHSPSPEEVDSAPRAEAGSLGTLERGRRAASLISLMRLPKDSSGRRLNERTLSHSQCCTAPCWYQTEMQDCRFAAACDGCHHPDHQGRQHARRSGNRRASRMRGSREGSE
ncbi:unnamed protein product [Polarella glacialis]|uniref:Uncharacterized protein n=1 Tax=Polarella glacialis TaxID=89957 RepID=A0A813JBG5_POLGL|nr:unnamed protein product [Polarella glacialis]